VFQDFDMGDDWSWFAALVLRRIPQEGEAIALRFGGKSRKNCSDDGQCRLSEGASFLLDASAGVSPLTPRCRALGCWAVSQCDGRSTTSAKDPSDCL